MIADLYPDIYMPIKTNLLDNMYLSINHLRNNNLHTQIWYFKDQK